ncbi:MAG: GIY-YIG nuclease family protein [Puniceicoccaceae bacterium]|nr:GIY-YIG nuclease family protein [Puniceicoccaceae bacterium]
MYSVYVIENPQGRLYIGHTDDLARRVEHQLSRSKKRKAVAEHAAVLAILDRIAEREGTTSTDLIRDAARKVVRKHARSKSSAESLRQVLEIDAPKPHLRARSPKELARFKKECREFDELAMDLGLNAPSEVQHRNSIHRIENAPVLIGRL